MSEETTFDINNMSALDMFGATSMTYSEASDKFAAEASKQYADNFQMKKNGTYAIRILPLMPIIKDGKPVPDQRPGYEYPITQQFLKIKGPDPKNKGKEKIYQQPVIKVTQAFPELKEDLIELFVAIANEKYADDEKFIKKVNSGNYEGGLRYDYGRAMYVIDLDDNEKIKLYQPSNSQYRQIDEIKMENWATLCKKDPTAKCPLTDPSTAFPLKITRSEENKKVKYTFMLDVLAGQMPVTAEQAKKLFSMPRLPEVIYRYTRRNLEATIMALKQYEEEWEVDIMSEERIKDCIDAIKAALPADDNSHFSFSSGDKKEKGDSIDDLNDAYNAMVEAGKGDRSPEGSELKTRIMEFIEKNNLKTKVGRKSTIADLLDDIEDELDGKTPEPEPEPEPAPARRRNRQPEPEPEPEPEDDGYDEEPEPEDEGVDQDNKPEPEPEPQVTRRSEERNDDTNEPAARPPRERRRHGSNRR